MSKYTQAQLDEHRHVHVDDNWWSECVVDDWASEMYEKGIRVEDKNIRWSGFWCQGDGASFSGWIDMAGYLKAHPTLLDDYIMIRTYLSLGGDPSITINTSGHRMVHEMTMDLEIETSELSDMLDLSEPLIAMSIDEWDRDFCLELHALEKELLDAMRDHARDLYQRLEAEYDYLTSDEVITEYLDSNPELLADDDDDSEDFDEDCYQEAA